MGISTQDEDIWVRETAGTAASAAAHVLYCRLASATEAIRITAEEKNVHLLLAAAASPASSEEPHGVEAGSLMQLLLEVLAKVQRS